MLFLEGHQDCCKVEWLGISIEQLLSVWSGSASALPQKLGFSRCKIASEHTLGTKNLSRLLKETLIRSCALSSDVVSHLSLLK